MSDNSDLEYEEVELDDSGFPYSFSSSFPATASSFQSSEISFPTTLANVLSSRAPATSPKPLSKRHDTGHYARPKKDGLLPGLVSPQSNSVPKSVGSPLHQAKPPPLPPPNTERKFGDRGTLERSPKATNGKPAPTVRKKPRRSHTISAGGYGKAPPPPPPPPRSDSVPDAAEEVPHKRPKQRSSSDYVICPDELTLPQFVEKHQQELPLRIVVCKGFYGVSERTSVSDGDSFNIHFVKRSKVVNLTDRHGGDYKIALNSAVAFGVMFNPLGNRVEASKGAFYNKASDLMALPSLPKIVRATTSFKGNGPESSVEVNELLAIRGIKKVLIGKVLKVFSLQTKQKKELAESCQGCFSTRPYDVKLYLPEIVEFLSDPFPLEVVLYINAETADQLPSTMVTTMATLKSCVVETSLIATGTVEDPDRPRILIDIPLDLDVDVQVMRPKDDDETEQLYEDTRELYQQFNPTNVHPYIPASSPNAYTMQNAFYINVRKGDELAGVDIIKPMAVFQDARAASSSSPSRSPCSAPTTPTTTRSVVPPPKSGGLSPPNPGMILMTQNPEFLGHVQGKLFQFEGRIQKLEAAAKSPEKSEHVTHLETDVARLSRDLMSSRADSMRTEGRVIKAVEEVNKLTPMVEYLQNLCETMQKELKDLQRKKSGSGLCNGYPPTMNGGPPSPNGQPSLPSLPSKAIAEQNRAFLVSLDSTQVIQLLESMGLKQYQGMFSREKITGEILAECDDNVLAQELNITSKLHRVRLLKVVSGRHSAESILRGGDPYVYATRAT